MSATGDNANRARAVAILETIAASQTWTGSGYSTTAEEVEDISEALNVPPALILLGSRQVSAAQVDELVAWWPRKEDGEAVA